MSDLADTLSTLRHEKIIADQRHAGIPEVSLFADENGHQHGHAAVVLMIGVTMGNPTRYIELNPDEARRLADSLKAWAARVEDIEEALSVQG